MMYNVTFEGKDYYYLPYLFVTSEVPMLAGREIWGYNKKLAEMKFIHVRNQISCTVDRPEGTRIATATVSPQVNLPKEAWSNKDIISLKLIPSAEEGKEPDVCQLIGCTFTLSPVVGTDGIAELWDGIGSITWGSESNDDPWHKNEVTKVLGGTYGRFNIHLPYGYVLHDYLKANKL